MKHATEEQAGETHGGPCVKRKEYFRALFCSFFHCCRQMLVKDNWGGKGYFVLSFQGTESMLTERQWACVVAAATWADEGENTA